MRPKDTKLAPITAANQVWSRKSIVRSVAVLALIPVHIYLPNIGLLLRGGFDTVLIAEAQFYCVAPLLANTLYWQSFAATTRSETHYTAADAAATGYAGYAYLAGLTLMLTKCIYSRINNPRATNTTLHDTILAIVIILILLSTFSSYKGYQADTNGWSTNLRTNLALAAVLYGLQLGMQYQQRIRIATSLMPPVGLALYSAIGIGLITTPLAWTLAAPTAAAASYATLSSRNKLTQLLSIACLASMTYVVYINPQTSTITLLSLELGGVVLGVVLAAANAKTNVFVRKLLSLCLGISLLNSIWLPFAFAPHADASVRSQRKDGIVRYAHTKLFADRAVLWNTVLDEMGDRNLSEKLIAPSGQAIKVTQYNEQGKLTSITMGAHNVFLETLFLQGYIPGLLSIGLFVLIFSALLRKLAVSNDPELLLLGYACTTTLIVGGFSGMFMIHQDGGTWFYLLTGITLAAATKTNRSPGAIESHRHQSAYRFGAYQTSV